MDARGAAALAAEPEPEPETEEVSTAAWVPRKPPIDHPTVEQQQAALERIMACVTESSVRALCAHVGLEFVSFEFLPEGEPGSTFGQYEGCQARPFNVNPNWVITAHRPGSDVDAATGSPTGKARALAQLPSTDSLNLSGASIDEFGDDEMILQVTNPHSWGARSITHSKVGAMQYLREKSIPLVPPVCILKIDDFVSKMMKFAIKMMNFESKVIAWSADPSSSPIGCEYLLMERANGIELRKIWDTLTPAQHSSYNRQLAEWVRGVGNVPRPLVRDFPFKMMNFVFKMMKLAFKMMNLAAGGGLPQRSVRLPCGACVFYRFMLFLCSK